VSFGDMPLTKHIKLPCHMWNLRQAMLYGETRALLQDG
jgi:hypothetical protein